MYIRLVLYLCEAVIHLDIDECEGDPCEEEFEMCLNTVGSYECGCIDGYKKEDGKCILDVTGMP